MESPAPPSEQAGHDLEEWLSRAISTLPGVVNATVWLTDLRRLRACHVTAAPNASAIIIANAAAQVLRRHGIQFSMEMIRVAFREEPTPSLVIAPTERKPSERFLVLSDLAVHRTGPRVTCTVTLARDGRTYIGEATELDTEAGRIRAAIRATLVAAENAGEDLALGLEGSAILDLFGRRYVASSIEATAGRDHGLLAGLVPIDPARSPEEAACMAALRAIDRWSAR